MPYSKAIKEEVREYRKQGLSLRKIQKLTNVPTTTIASWTADIKLSEDQLRILENRVQKALQAGRKRAQKLKKDTKEKHAMALFTKGKRDINRLNQKELFITGVALYWAEGFKNRHEHRLGFCNSDPSMITFYIQWLKKSLGTQEKDVIVRLTLNKSYRNKINEIQNYWSQITGIPLNQFTKPFYQNSKWKKQYNTDNYHGVLRIHVKNSLDYLLKMRGWIEGLKSSVVE